MKLEQLIVQYLYSNKTVTLQEIGTFQLSTDVVIPHESDKDFVLPENAIQFEYNLKAGPDDGLVDYIVQQTRKIKPLAKSDLESYSNLNKQFLNIGKPLVIEGLGTLHKIQSGAYIFSQSTLFNTKTEPLVKALKEKTEEDINFSTTQKDPGSKNKKGWLMGILFAFFIGATGSMIYYYMYLKQDGASEKNVVVLPTDSLIADSANLKKDSSSASIPIATNDAYRFKVILKHYPSRAAAERQQKKLISYGHQILLSTKDSITYSLKIPFTRPLSDTTIVKDSLDRFFGAKTTIDLNP